MPGFYFLHIASGQFWPTNDSHRWLLDSRDDALLAAARERLVLSADDPERCLRAALRRCGLVLVRVVSDSQIVVRYWSGHAPDLRAWAKDAGWNRPGVQVVVVEEKTGKIVTHEDGRNVLMHGEPVGPDFRWEMYELKHARRHDHEVDDHDIAPASATNFVWANCPNGRLTWQVLKSIWNAEKVSCPNCDQPNVFLSFNWPKGMLSFRSARLVRHCFRCRRRFEVREEKPLVWLARVLPPAQRPTHLRLWAMIPINWLVPSLGVGRSVQLDAGEV
jgi:hypothetical protein